MVAPVVDVVEHAVFHFGADAAQLFDDRQPTKGHVEV
jgi:hypothetical protein